MSRVRAARRECVPRPRQRVPDCDRLAVDVHSAEVDAKALRPGEQSRRERLLYLEPRVKSTRGVTRCRLRRSSRHPFPERFGRSVGCTGINSSALNMIIVNCRSGTPRIAKFPRARPRREHPSRLFSTLLDNSRLASSRLLADMNLTETNFSKVQLLTEWAKERGRTLGETALSWLIAQATVSCVIVGATNADQVRANVGGASLDLGRHDLDSLRSVLDRFESPPDRWQLRLATYAQARGLA
jgi:hypothetical protein